MSELYIGRRFSHRRDHCVSCDAQSLNIYLTAAVKPSPPRFASGGFSVYELPHDTSAGYDTVFLGKDQCIRRISNFCVWQAGPSNTNSRRWSARIKHVGHVYWVVLVDSEFGGVRHQCTQPDMLDPTDLLSGESVQYRGARRCFIADAVTIHKARSVQPTCQSNITMLSLRTSIRWIF